MKDNIIIDNIQRERVEDELNDYIKARNEI
jgi:hypothetical protein